MYLFWAFFLIRKLSKKNFMWNKCCTNNTIIENFKKFYNNHDKIGFWMNYRYNYDNLHSLIFENYKINRNRLYLNIYMQKNFLL